jgi:hypothetical protein
MLAVQHRESDPVGCRVVPDGPDDVPQQGGLTGPGVAQHQQQRVLGEIEFDCGQVLFALTDDDPIVAAVHRAECGRRQVGRQQPHRRSRDPGMALVDGRNLVQLGRREQEVLGGHGQAATRLVSGHRLGRPVQCAGHPDVAVAGVVQLELQPQPQAVAHRQRDLDPAGGGDDDVDTVRQSDIHQLSHLAQQGIPGVVLVRVVPAERIQVVDDQEHLAQPVVRTLLVAEHLPLLTRPQQLFELTEGAPDAFGLQ